MMPPFRILNANILGNGNLISKTDPDGFVTTYGYNGLDMVTSINYNGGKEVSYQ